MWRNGKEMYKKRTKTRMGIIVALLTAIYIVLEMAARRRDETGDIDKDNSYIKEGKTVYPKTQKMYEKNVKPIIDKLFSFAGLIILSPLYGFISLAIYLDNPGPVLFVQKRVGKDGHFFYLHKYRSMFMSTPHDVPTHQLNDPDQYITKIGKILRKTSLDELPQIWDIFRGKMSIIGPRPALWNQADLIEEREKYGANSVVPGLTGLAQIKGRDELEISDKAKIDGEYVRILNRGGIIAFYQDIRCLFKTVGAVLCHKGVVEGGTGEIHKQAFITDEVRELGCYKKFCIQKDAKKKVLITGEGSYVGDNFRQYVEKHYPNITVDTIDMIDNTWRKKRFDGYDTIFHVAGIAHVDVENVKKEVKNKYFEVNTDLAIETAKVAKAAKVQQFIFMSSMIIYGDCAPYGVQKVIDEYTIPSPSNIYGKSKWKGDIGVREMADEGFHVAVLRPPMIYGKGAKGNYSLLSKLAKQIPIFPDIENNRSMLYIDNLCEFVSQLVLSGNGGIYFPQNREYSNTSKLVENICNVTDKKIWITKLLNPMVKVASHIPGKISRLSNKAFGNSIYRQYLSFYEGIDYQVISLEDSIILTEDDN